MATKISRESYEHALVRGCQALEAPYAVSVRYLELLMCWNSCTARAGAGH
jgi:hypothetical protein